MIIETIIGLIVASAFLTAFALVMPVLYALPKHPAFHCPSCGRIKSAYERYLDYWIEKEWEWENQ